MRMRGDFLYQADFSIPQLFQPLGNKVTGSERPAAAFVMACETCGYQLRQPRKTDV